MINLKLDASEVISSLDDLSARDAKQAMQKATKKAGNFLAGKARKEAPSRPRKLRASVRARNAKRDRPGAVVSARHRLSPIVQWGTVDRFTKGGAFRGRITQNPFITRTADQWDDEAMRVAEDELAKSLDL